MQYINPDAIPVPNTNWYSHPDYLNYAITPEGQIWSFNSNRFLQPEVNHKGYLKVELWNNGSRSRHFVHRLVGWVFIELPEEFNRNYDIATINHKDNNKTNNHYTNLEWVTREYNVQDAWINGYYCRLMRPCFCIDMYTRRHREFDRMSLMAEYLGYDCEMTRAYCKNNKIIGRQYIVGYLDDPMWQELFANLSINDICEAYLYSNRNYSPFLVTDLVTNETTQYNRFVDASKDIGISPTNISSYIKSGRTEPLQGRYSIERLYDVMNSFYHNYLCF